MGFEEFVVESVPQYLEAILEINDRTGSISGAVFRGQSDSRWGVSSGLSRFCARSSNVEDAIRRAEQAFLIFNAQRHGYHNLVSSNPWDVLTLAQHFGMPTRLLDWSLSPTVALFFALDGVRYTRVRSDDLTDEQRDEFSGSVPIDGDYVGIPESDAVVYMIPASHKDSQIQWLHASDLPSNVFEKIPEAEDHGFCFINPDVTNDRIKLQSGLFTIGVDPHSAFPVNKAYKIVLKRGFTASMRGELVSLNIGAKSVYGDLEGLCKELLFTKFGGFANRYKS